MANDGVAPDSHSPLVQRRFDRVAWRVLPEGSAARLEYERLEKELWATARTRKEARSGVNYLYHFVCRFLDSRGDPVETAPDPRVLSGTQPDLVHAVRAWEALQRAAVWGPTYLREVRTSLSRALIVYGEPLAHVVNPGLYKGACAQTRFHVMRSHQTTFTLHECLPWRVRRLPPGGPEYALLTRVGERMSGCLASVSKGHLQSILVLFDHLLHDPPRLWPVGCQDSLEERWRFLQGLSAREWLYRYGALFQRRRPDDDQDDHEDRRIGFDLFKRQVRYISQFHGQLHPNDHRRHIPVPTCHRITWHNGGGGMADHGSTALSWSSSSSFGSSGGETAEDDEAARVERRSLVNLLGDLRQRCCRPPTSALEEAERRFAFTPAEVRRLVEMASAGGTVVDEKQSHPAHHAGAAHGHAVPDDGAAAGRGGAVAAGGTGAEDLGGGARGAAHDGEEQPGAVDPAVGVLPDAAGAVVQPGQALLLVLREEEAWGPGAADEPQPPDVAVRVPLPPGPHQPQRQSAARVAGLPGAVRAGGDPGPARAPAHVPPHGGAGRATII